MKTFETDLQFEITLSLVMNKLMLDKYINSCFRVKPISSTVKVDPNFILKLEYKFRNVVYKFI